MIFEGLTLAEYLEPRIKQPKQPKEKRIKKSEIVLNHHKAGEKNCVCAFLADCSERWARRVISKHKKALNKEG